MPDWHNSDARYGAVIKTFHWLTALLILTLLPLGQYAQYLAQIIESAEGSPDQALISRTAFLFSLHKTLGVTVFFVALLRILWALSQPKPRLLNGDKPAEALAAEAVHWLLYGSLVLVPLSGWVHHASTSGFAPIWWPFGQTLPFVSENKQVAEISSRLHYLLQWVLVGALTLHILGALKHHVIDRDATLRRMWFGKMKAEGSATQPGHVASFIAALAVWGVVIGGAAAAGWFDVAPQEEQAPVSLAAGGGNWQVQDGTLQITVTQMGSEITGTFSDWSAQIQYADTADENGKHGEVVVEIATGSLSLGSVTDQATGPGYLASQTHPVATFKADLMQQGNGLVAIGDLTIRDDSVPVELPVSLAIEGQRAEASGRVQVDRRDFNMGTDVTDEGSLAFGVGISFDLTAERAAP